MPHPASAARQALQRLGPVPPAFAFAAVCLTPYLSRLRDPSLYADDVDRVSQLQTVPLLKMLFLPFNEHVAPLFQGVSWMAWQVSGGRLDRTPLVFTLASFLPFVPTLVLLGLVVRRETRSLSASLTCVAAFALSWLHVETIFWYSASSFMWALLTTLIAWFAAARTCDPLCPGRRIWGGVALLASASAPAFSAVGLLAGPVAALRSATAERFRALAVAGPLAGTLAAILLYGVTHDRAALASSVGQSAGVPAGLLTAARAPAAALVPALAGLGTRRAAGSGAVVQTLLSMTVAGWLVGRTSRGVDRPVTLGGLALIFGGYALTFCARAGEPGRALLETQRYHLFPMLGLVLLLAPWVRKALGRLDPVPTDALWAVTAVAGVLFCLHSTEMKGRARFLRYPDQSQTLAAIDRLARTCRRLGVSRAQALAALDPIETAWTPPGRNALVLLPPTGPGAGSDDPGVRGMLLGALSPADVRSLCGGMDATPYLNADDGTTSSSAAVGRRVALFRIEPTRDGRYVSAGWPSFVEYELPHSAAGRALVLPATDPGALVEFWWRGDGDRWSETRSVRLRPRPGPAGSLLPLDRLPHFDPAEARRVRLLYHAPGPVAAAPPRVVR